MASNDPAHYRDISKPFETRNDANEALSKFFADVRAARDHFRIADVIVICELSHKIDGEEVSGHASSNMGDSGRVLQMLAREYGAEQVRHEEALKLITAHARKRNL